MIIRRMGGVRPPGPTHSEPSDPVPLLPEPEALPRILPGEALPSAGKPSKTPG
jgi:hypothetical protein